MLFLMMKDNYNINSLNIFKYILAFAKVCCKEPERTAYSFHTGSHNAMLSTSPSISRAQKINC